MVEREVSVSLSTDRYGGDSSGHKARPGNPGLPSSRTRRPTPPLLFGRHAISAPEKSKTMSSLVLGQTTSRPGSHHASNGFLPIYAYPASWNPEVPFPTIRGVGVPSLALQPAW